MISFALPSWGSGLQNAINKIFPNQIKVYGVKIIGTEITPLKDIEKAAKILKQWLDNDGDEKPDNSLVVSELVKNNAILAMGKTENDLEDSFDNLIDVLEEIDVDVDNFERSLVGLISEEWELNTPQKMEKDKFIMEILKDEKYQIPTKLPSF